jgi:hypothetical protein
MRMNPTVYLVAGFSRRKRPLWRISGMIGTAFGSDDDGVAEGAGLVMVSLSLGAAIAHVALVEHKNDAAKR